MLHYLVYSTVYLSYVYRIYHKYLYYTCILYSFPHALYIDGPEGVHGRGPEMGLGQGQNYDQIDYSYTHIYSYILIHAMLIYSYLNTLCAYAYVFTHQ